MVSVNNFGFINDEEIKIFTLSNGKIIVKILNYGGIIHSIFVPDKFGNLVDVTLGYENIEGYLNGTCYFGAIIGRVANRIGNAKFLLNGKEYKLFDNDNGNSLHGGESGFNDKIWQSEILDNALKLTYFSPDGEENYPANLTVSVTYSLEDCSLKIFYEAIADGDTPINLTNHAYFNLDGEGTTSCLDTLLQIDADYITPVSEKIVPTGELSSVKNTPFDFAQTKTIGKDICLPHPQLIIGKGYDINFCLKGEGLRKISTAKSNNSKIVMETFTDAKAMQLYTANYVDGEVGKNGHIYGKRSAFCLETQGFPNAVNEKNFPSTILKKGETFNSTTIYKFSVDK